MFKKIFILILLICISCDLQHPTEFSKNALQENLYNLEGTSFTFKEILSKYKGKKIFIDFWASWCRDCIKGIPKVNQLQEEFPEVVFLILSTDEKNSSWKKGVKRFKFKGIHYNLPKGSKQGDLVNFINLNWIPRYMVLDENGKILLFKATDASDEKIIEALNAYI